MKDYLEELRNPDQRARGLTRWWWYGCAVKKEEIIAQLDEMQRQNIGGVEVQILYPVTADQKETGRKNIEYFSPEFFDILDFTSKETRKRKMTFDLTLGSSWPYGGPFVPYELSAPVVHPYTIDVTGPTVFSYDFTTRISGDIVGCIMGKMEHSEMLPETIVDLQEKIEKNLLFNWPWGEKLEGIEIPEGDYKIVVFVSHKYRQHVLAPSRGAEGLVIDHNRKDAARLFFEQAGTPIVRRLGKGAVTSFFCDSIEVSGHNWTNLIFEEFEKRRGYSLKPYIYALWGEVKGITQSIRYDFQKTYAELTVENFFREMTDWCHEMGSTSRIQAHGTWGDVLLAYGAADIPEGESFSEFDKYTVNTIHRRLASSAGNVYHKPIISNESFTWLRFPRFTETLEQIKAETDAIFLDGMNQIVNHGFTYQPSDGEAWPFYASSHICNTNTWWKHYRTLGDYIQRVSHFMQKGRTKAEVCIYLPQNDIWAESPLCDLHMCMKLRERLEDDVIDAVAKAGYWFDYVNDDVISRISEYPYKVLLILETERMPVSTVESIRRFAEQGNIVICAQQIPDKSCGYLNAQENNAYVEKTMKKLYEEGLLLFAENKREALISLLKKSFVPDLEITEGQEDIGYIHKTDKNADIYFLSNISKKGYLTTLRFKNQKSPCMLLDPMTGQKKSVLKIGTADTGKELQLMMEPQQSILVIFDDSLEEQAVEMPLIETGSKDISKEWEFRVEEKGISVHMPELLSWEKIPELKYYSGTGVYERTLCLSSEDIRGKRIFLKLEHLGECASVFLNNHLAGEMIQYPYEVELTEQVIPGENTIRIEVVNLLINSVIDPEYSTPLYEDDLIQQWPYFTGPLNMTRKKRLSNWREKEMVKEPVPSGIWGRAEIVFKSHEGAVV